MGGQLLGGPLQCLDPEGALQVQAHSLRQLGLRLFAFAVLPRLVSFKGQEHPKGREVRRLGRLLRPEDPIVLQRLHVVP